ncbi:MAG: uroporphyrinogen decarboxylase [Alphaproteobacteria bacterium]|nr:uroporphyrinogen decarboxylase [Alphaproteobacteria bacterium]
MRENKRLLRALDGLEVDRPPFWYMRQAGRYLPEYRQLRAKSGGFLDMCYSPEKAAEVTLQPIRRFDMDAAILFCDILVIPHALGIGLDFVAGEGPKLDAHDTKEKIMGLGLTDVVAELAPVYEAVELITQQLPKDKTLIGFCGAPWTVATYIVEGGSSRDFTKTRTLAIQDPQSFSYLIDLLIDASVAHLVAQVDAGAEAVQIFDSWAGILPEGEFEQWCITPMRQLIDKFKAICPGVPLIAFPKGAGMRYASYAYETSADALGVDMSMPLDGMQMIAETTVVQGNLDPLLLAYDLPRALDQAKAILHAMDKSPFIFNLGHGVIQYTPPEHVEALSALLRDWKP